MLRISGLPTKVGSPFFTDIEDARCLRENGKQEVLAKPLGKIDSGDSVVVHRNRSDKEAAISFNTEEISVAANSGYAMLDLWKKETLEKSSRAEKVSFPVTAHGLIAMIIKGRIMIRSPFK